jgi:hypothetical protein
MEKPNAETTTQQKDTILLSPKASVLIQPRLRAPRPGLQAILALRAEI